MTKISSSRAIGVLLTDENGDPVLFGYTCDLPRLKRFDTVIQAGKRTGTVYCYDFQKEVLAGVMCEYVRFETIQFDKWERLFFGDDAT